MLEAVQTALTLNPWSASQEPVFLKGVPKGKGDGVRPVYTFGLNDYASQLLAATAVRATADLHPNQFTYQGGIRALAAWLNNNLGAAKVVMTTDVPSHHLVLNRKRLIDDGVLPTPVMSSLLFEPMERAKPKPLGSSGVLLCPQHFPKGVLVGHTSLKGSGKPDGRGIPPGSALSQIVAENSLRRVLQAVEGASEGVAAGSQADNVVILAATSAAASASIKALRHAALIEFGEDVADGLQTRTEISYPEDGFRFLGSNWRWEAGQLSRTLAPGTGAAFVIRLISDALNDSLSEEEMVNRLRGWLSYANFDPASIEEVRLSLIDCDIPQAVLDLL